MIFDFQRTSLLEVDPDIVYTSYFSRPDFRRQLSSKDQRILATFVNVARRPPAGIIITSYPDLFPTAQILDRFKHRQTEIKKLADREESDRQTRIMETEYEESYRKDVLSSLNPTEVYNLLRGKVCLCYEKSGSFCHRNIFSRWLVENGFKSMEFGVPAVQKQEPVQQGTLF